MEKSELVPIDVTRGDGEIAQMNSRRDPDVCGGCQGVIRLEPVTGQQQPALHQFRHRIGRNPNTVHQPPLAGSQINFRISPYPRIFLFSHISPCTFPAMSKRERIPRHSIFKATTRLNDWRVN